MKKFAISINNKYLVEAYAKFLYYHNFQYIELDFERKYLVPDANGFVIHLIDDLPPDYPVLDLGKHWDLANSFIVNKDKHDINVGDTVRFKEDGEIHTLEELVWMEEEGNYCYSDENGAKIFLLGEEDFVEKVVDSATKFVYQLKKEEVNKEVIKRIIKELKEMVK